MRIEDLSVVLRPRRPWEAVDLGCVLVRRDYFRILALWLTTVVPFWVTLAAVMWQHPLWFSVVVWWLKPLYDRVPLFFLSRAAFGARPGFRENWKAGLRLPLRFAFPALFWRRLSPIRSFALPVRMLENLRGKALGTRIQGLAREGGGTAAKAWVSFFHLETAVYFGLLGLTSSAAPESGLPDMEDLFIGGFGGVQDIGLGFYWYLNVLYLVAITVIEPFYVGAGFGLYLNCRSKLEGWDIEVAFRKLAARVQAGLQKVALVAGVLFLLAQSGGLGGAAAQETDAQGETKAAGLEREVDNSLETVLDREEFEIHRKKGREWVEDSSGSLPPMPWLALLFKLLGWMVFIAALGCAIFFLVRYLAQLRGPIFQRRPQKEKAKARSVMGLEITAESLPDDLLGAARERWQAGQHREAMSLLYRGALFRLIQIRRVPIEDSDTEDDCLLRVVGQEEPKVVAYFTELTGLWVTAAYAGREATTTQFEKLCESWPFDLLAARQSPVSMFARSTAIACLAVSASFCLTGCSGHWEDYDREVGYRGKARVDPFLAAQQFLIERGHFAERNPSLKNLPYSGEGVVFTSAENGMPIAAARPLLEWVGDGGHLVYVIAGGAAYNDWKLLSRLGNLIYFGNDKRPDPILEELGITTNAKSLQDKIAEIEDELDEQIAELEENLPGEVESGNESSEDNGPAENAQDKDNYDVFDDWGKTPVVLKWRKKRLNLELLQTMQFFLNRDFGRGEFAAEAPADFSESRDEDTIGQGYYMLSLKHGSGRVTVLNHAQPFRNRYLGDVDHALWLDRLVGRDGKDVRFVLGFEGGFWALLWQRAWAVLLGLALIVVLWLWKNLPRFGPVSEVRLHETQRFAGHLTALGPFYLRIKRTDVLLAAACEAVRSRLLRTLPQMLSADEDVRLKLLAERSKLPIERVRSAMHSPDEIARKGRHLTIYLQDLQTIRNSL